MERFTIRSMPVLGTWVLLVVGCEVPEQQPEARSNPPEGVSVEIVSANVENNATSLIHAKLRFSNNTDAPVWILKPVDGSEWGWHMPNYRFTVVAESGEMIPPAPRCGLSGLWADTRWPDDYLVEIRTRRSSEIQVHLPQQPDRRGKHTISFQYVYQPVQEQFPPPPQAWRGVLSSEPVTVECKPDRPE